MLTCPAEPGPASRVAVVPSGTGPERLLEAAEAGLVPILAPKDQRRLAGWVGVLEALQASPGAAPAAGTAHDPIIAVDRPGRRVAEAMAAATGRPTLAVRSVDDIDADDDPVGSLLLVGLAGSFTAAHLDRLAMRVRSRPLGLITGRDQEGLSFAVAKALLAAPPRPGPFALLDAVTGRFVEDGRRVAPPNVAEHLLSGRWGRLVINAHGESGHLDLGSAVLCGVWGERETRAGRVVPRGCSATACKRAGDGIPAVPVRALSADELVLLSCNSFTVVPNLFPSSVSAVVAAAEGAPAAVVGLDRPLPIESWIGAALNDRASRRGLGEWVRILNDVEEQRSGQRPFFLAGDPAAGIEPTPADEALTETPAPPGRCPVLRVPGSPGATAFPSRTGALVVSADGAGGRRPVVAGDPVVVDVRRETAVLAARLRRHAEGLATAGQLQRAIGDVLPAGAVSTAVRERLAVMQRATEQLGTCLQRAGRVLSQVSQRGAEDRVLNRFADVASRYGRTWERAWAAALHAGLIQEPLELLLLDGTEPVAREALGPCPLCRCRLRREVRRSTLLALQRILIHCPTCGVREIRTRRGPPMSLELPVALHRGQVVPVRILHHGWEAGEPASFVLQLKDNGRDRVLPVAAGSLDGPVTERAMEVPVDGASEVHTIRLAVVRHLEMTYLRHRLPLFGGEDEDDDPCN